MTHALLSRLHGAAAVLQVLHLMAALAAADHHRVVVVLVVAVADRQAVLRPLEVLQVLEVEETKQKSTL